jgi:hypothetical protein
MSRQLTRTVQIKDGVASFTKEIVPHSRLPGYDQ